MIFSCQSSKSRSHKLPATATNIIREQGSIMNPSYSESHVGFSFFLVPGILVCNRPTPNQVIPKTAVRSLLTLNQLGKNSLRQTEVPVLMHMSAAEQLLISNSPILHRWHRHSGLNCRGLLYQLYVIVIYLEESFPYALCSSRSACGSQFDRVKHTHTLSKARLHL
jgi:hypothetical protein